jgi:hypothetical protein
MFGGFDIGLFQDTILAGISYNKVDLILSFDQIGILFNYHKSTYGLLKKRSFCSFFLFDFFKNIFGQKVLGHLFEAIGKNRQADHNKEYGK